jgi:hypothetical protein
MKGLGSPLEGPTDTDRKRDDRSNVSAGDANMY